MSVDDLVNLEIVEAAALIAARELKPSELVAAVVERATATDPLLGAFVSLDADRAVADARAQDDDVTAGPLRGIPVAVKDIFDLAGQVTGWGSPLQAGARPAVADAHVVRRLRGAGAIIVGKTHTHELACGVYTPPTRNPRDLERSPGGSSGGSGAAVAAGAAFAGLGSDTGGSIRIPAAHCGIVGLKPTYGRVSRAGALALSWSLDHVGPLTRSVRDAALVLSAVAGPDAADPTTLAQPPLHAFDAGTDVRGLRVGVLTDAPFAPLAPEQAAALAAAEELLAAQGVELEHIAIPEFEHALAAEFAIVAAEAASYHETRLVQTPELIGDGVRGLLETGMLLPASVYLRAQRTRRAMQQAVARCFAEHRLDGLLAPTVPAAAQRLDELEFRYANGTVEPVIDALVRTTAPHNLTGLPTVAVPLQLPASPLPGSVQLSARPYDEPTALHLAHALEQAAGRPEPPAAVDAAPAATA